MQRFNRVCKGIAWASLGLFTFFQIMAIISTLSNNLTRIIPPVWFALLLFVATAGMWSAMLLFFSLEKKRSIAYLEMVVSVALCVVLAIMMPSVFPTAYDLNGTELGVNWWEAIMRHLVPPVLSVACVFPLWLEYHQEYRAEKDAAAAPQTPSYFDEFKDGFKMRALDEEYAKPTKEKRSVRQRKSKESSK